MENRFLGSLENIFPLIEKKVQSTFQEHMNHRTAALARTSENLPVPTSYTNHEKTGTKRVTCPDIFNSTQI